MHLCFCAASPRAKCGLGILLVAVFLAGCETMPVTPVDDVELAWKQHLLSLARVDRWQFKGRIGIRTEQDGWNAKLHSLCLSTSYPVGPEQYNLEGLPASPRFPLESQL